MEQMKHEGIEIPLMISMMVLPMVQSSEEEELKLSGQDLAIGLLMMVDRLSLEELMQQGLELMM
jgi:hypothetical protein